MRSSERDIFEGTYRQKAQSTFCCLSLCSFPRPSIPYTMLHKPHTIDFFSDSNDSKAAGRWTAEEHNMFLQGLKMYNKQWKLIADLVKTRTVVQIRTHAQKYFQKLEKGRSSNLSTRLEMEIPSSPYCSKAGARADSITSADGYEFTVGSQGWDGDTDSEKESPRVGGHKLRNTKESKKRPRDESSRFRMSSRSQSEPWVEKSDPLLEFLPLEEMPNEDNDQSVLLFWNKFEWQPCSVGLSLHVEGEDLTPENFFDAIESAHSLTPLSDSHSTSSEESSEIGIICSFRERRFDLERSYLNSQIGELCSVRANESVDTGSSRTHTDNDLESVSAPKKRGRPRKNSSGFDTEPTFLHVEPSVESSDSA